MTLEAAVERLRNRLRVDLEAEVDIDNAEVAAAEIWQAYKEFARDSYCFYTPRSAITLTVKTGANTGKYNILSTCADRMFELRSADGYALHVNGAWIPERTLPDFERMHRDYYALSTSAHPSSWAYVGPEEIQIADPPNQAACDATDNYVRGFYEPAEFTYNGNKNEELPGSDIYHRLVVIKAALNLSEGYVSSDQGYQRRGSYTKTYKLAVFGGMDTATATMQPGLRNQNLERVRPLTRKKVAGSQRRIFGPYDARGW